MPVHHDGHTQRGQTAVAQASCLDYAIERLGAERIAAWYHRIRPEIGLPCGSIHLFERGEYAAYLKSLLS